MMFALEKKILQLYIIKNFLNRRKQYKLLRFEGITINANIQTFYLIITHIFHQKYQKYIVCAPSNLCVCAFARNTSSECSVSILFVIVNKHFKNI